MPVTLTLDNIQFPATQVPNAGVNVLDDYEEGTWTPALAFATSGSVTYNASYTFAGSGRYTKVGRLVHLQCIIVLTAISSPTGAITITGLPFAPQNYAAASVMGGLLNAAITSALMATVNPVSGVIHLFKAAAGGNAALVGSDLAATSEFYFAATYTV
jgi:hypothetical protein